jgi:hypothetical protein
MSIMLPFGTGEREILERVLADPRHVLEQRPGGYWTTPSTPIFDAGQPRWWAVTKALDQLRRLGVFRFRLGPKPAGGSSFPELELTELGKAYLVLLRENIDEERPCT